MIEITAQSILQGVRNAEDTQGDRRASEISAAGGAEPGRITSEVLEKAARRTFSAEYK